MGLRSTFIALAGLALAAPGLAAGAPPAIAREQNVGMVTRDYTDPTRLNWTSTGPRPLRTAIWYPAPHSAAMTENVSAGFFQGGAVAPAAAVAAGRGRYPLIVLSHGTGGSAVQMMWLGRRLAAQGYIVAAVNHHGNTSSEQQRRAEGFLLYWERATDLSRVIEAVLADPLVGPRIDRSKIGAGGFSLGGFTVLLAGGARFSSAQYDAFCASPKRDFTCEPQPEHPAAHADFAAIRQTPRVVEALRRSGDSFRDRRIKAVFVIAPALGSGLTADSLKKMPVPAEIVVGDGDVTTPGPTNAARLADLIPGFRLTVLPNATHYTFLDPCDERGQLVLDICRDPPPTDRATVHRQVAELAASFFRTNLR